MPANFLSNLRYLSATTCPSMALYRPFLFPSLKLKHSPFLPSTCSGFSVRAISSSPSSFRAGFSRNRSDAPRERMRDQVAVRKSAKSLVDDEAELSDWVNELRTSSYRGKLTSDEDDDDGDRRMRTRNDNRRGSDDEELSPLWNSPSRRYGNKSESPRHGVGDRRSGDGRVGDRRFGDGRIGDRRVSDRRFGDGKVDDRRVGERRFGDGRGGGGRFGDGRVGDRRFGNGRDGGGSVGDRRFGDGRGGGGRVGDRRFGDERVGDRRFGDGRDGGGRVGDRRFGDGRGGVGRDGYRKVGDRNLGRSTGFSDSVGKRGTGGFDSVRKVADDEEYKRGRFRNGDDRSIRGRNKGGSSSFSKFNGRQGRGDSDRVRRGAAFLDEDEESDGRRFRQHIDDSMSNDETDDEEEEDEDDSDEGLFRKGSGSSVGDMSEGKSFLNSNGKMGKGVVRKTDITFDEDEEFNMGMLKQDIEGLISEDDDDEGDEVGHVKEHGNEEKEVNIAGDDSYLSETRFDQCEISPLTLKGIRDVGYEKMTLVQEATLPVILKGTDVLAKAKTGTGKTVAFLLPSIEVITKSPPIGRDQKRPPILVLVICPTRELALQAAKEATTLLKYHPSIGVQVVIGGTRLPLEQKRMQTNPCQILVATPGRLRDHLENTDGFATRLMGVKVLVLDEADHLLDMGFRKDIERIIAAVPKQRQTLLFSATVPDEVRQVCHIALKRDHEFVNTVQEGSEETHAQVKQTHLVAPLDKHFGLLFTLLKDHIADDVNYKVLVFCTTAMVTKLVADLLRELKLNTREIHSRKSQSYRTKVSDEFRKSKGLILVTSDVSARGVDYPDVTLVIQIGLPSDREQYIHRLGRTGRTGKDGQGVLMLAPWEEFFLSTIKDLPLSKAAAPLVDPDTITKVERALSNVEMKSKESAYQAWLGYYNSDKNIGKDKYRLVELANEFSRGMGLDSPPAIPKIVLGKMGLRNIPGLRSK